MSIKLGSWTVSAFFSTLSSLGVEWEDCNNCRDNTSMVTVTALMGVKALPG